MKKPNIIIISLLTTLLLISSIPISLYLLSPNQPIIPDDEFEITLNQFASYEELKEYLDSNPEGEFYTTGGRTALDSNEMWVTPEEPAAPSMSGDAAEKQSTDYSKTNIQVEGVDEADIVKTDGEYIYVAAQNNLTIIKAYPPQDASVVSKITFDGSIMGLYINQDKLAVFLNEYQMYILYERGMAVDSIAVEPGIPESSETIDSETSTSINGTDPKEPDVIAPPPDDPVRPPEPIIWEPPNTTVKVYDISDKENPTLTRDFSIDGNYFNSRMIGDYVYIVATMYTYRTATEVALPRVHVDDETETIQAEEIYYSNLSDTSYTFTTIVALNINDDNKEPTHETILMGGTGSIYVSQNNIYLTFPDYSWQENQTMKTRINRAKIDQDKITFVAEGQVPGYLLNQFSMDEYNNHFRITTTIPSNWRTFAEEQKSTNNLYVLNMDLNIVGQLENLAPGEQIYSTRFIGNRGYMVTFRNIDPLFVIDLSDPTSPTVLGELKVTGYSGYLHIYDENHVLGIGKETIYDAREDFAWYQGIKISLFDVSDVSNPIEVAKYEIGDRGTDSPILYDHKSLLFDKEKNLLVIPVLLAEINPNNYPEEIPDWAYGDIVWQGAYILDISLDGIELRGQITHAENGTPYGYYYYYSEYTVVRSLYIEDVLYTISSKKIKMNDLETLTPIKEIQIN
jgi:uncharacterized secreted protein with C-terminal beta-propeller domain